MVDISVEAYEDNGAETVVDSGGILWFNENDIEGLYHKDLLVTTVKHLSSRRIHRCELVNKPKYNLKKFIQKKLATKVIMDCRKAAAHKFRTRLWFKQYDVILMKEQQVLTKIKN